ncbi:MAG TPA: hypothetical protein VKB57_24235 [Acidimicrobiales bacterium]|nr:hypothetical protein [Acidimicrobiales bacterium]
MELWSPPRDEPHLFEWWRPLVMASRRARAEGLPWPVHVDEYRLSGRVVRRGRPDVWIYEHHANGGAVCVDQTGSAYRFVATPGADDGAIGQFRACPLAESLRRAGIPQVTGRVTYHRPDPPPVGAGADVDADADGPAADDPPEPPRPPIRRGHLTLVAGCA